MNMHDGSTADHVIRVDLAGKKGRPDWDAAYQEGLALARAGEKVLMLVQPGTYELVRALELHPNFNIRGVGSGTTPDTQND